MLVTGQMSFKDDEGYVILPSRFFTGLVVAVVVPMEGYEAMAGNDVLLFARWQ